MKTIVLDPGHGGTDPGAVLGNRYEKNDNLRMALEVGKLLQNRGQRVIFTRDTDRNLTLQERTNIANASNGDLLVSLHRNSTTSSAANGVENYVRLSPSEREITYATTVLNSVVNAGVQSNRGVKKGNYYILQNSRIPAMLLELGFITNPTDNLMFDNNFYIYADAIANGILTALGEPLAPSGSDVIRSIQRTLNDRYGAGLSVDGIVGPRTKRALTAGLQTELNRTYNAGLVADGIFGSRTRAAVRNVRQGDRGNIVYLLQAALYLAGYPVAVDGIFGPMTRDAVIRYQAANNLGADGIAGPLTFSRLFS